MGSTAPDYLTISEAAEFLRVSVYTVQRLMLVLAGRVPNVRWIGDFPI